MKKRRAITIYRHRERPAMAGGPQGSGKDHYKSDKTALDKLLKIAPKLSVAVSENRAFLGRAVTVASQLGTRQFLNLGSDLPTLDGISVTDIARRYHSDARVVYVDPAEQVAAHGRVLRARDSGVLIVHEDARGPDQVLRAAAELLDFRKPICLIATAVAHFWSDEDNPAHILHHYMGAFPAGHLILSHACGEEMSSENFRAACEEAFAPIYPRSQAEISNLLEGLTLLKPGLVEASQWRDIRKVDVGEAYFLAAVAKIGGDGQLRREPA
ncbi:SAM-dependent methyltransferase [Nonomuraea sp. NPDC046802]|uniref:SAM-dependent methyltransferase n=1 Tax=Nonomuraea sp. NPDC046802 TaxID=3154919 RepID=UPI00340B7781